MQENSRYAVGIDVGTTTVRCVVGHIDPATGTPTIVGIGRATNNGMRKGMVANLQGPAKAIDEALGEAERMSGYQVHDASVSINGSHVLSTKADGMIAVGAMDHEINGEDIHRIQEVATLGKIPANRDILDVIAHTYRLDGQDGIRDPIGMTGTRLEILASVVSALSPHVQNVQKSAELASVRAHTLSPSVIAGSHAVLKESQIENGVAVIDIGGATTSVAVFEEGDLQHVGVIPIGGNNITNDLAIGLKTDPEIAEQVKVSHASATSRKDASGVSIKHEKEVYTFDLGEVDEIVEARLEEIFDAVQAELKKAGRAGKLPSGVVLIGGTANMKNIAEFAKLSLGLAARVGHPSGFGGVAEDAEKPEFAAAVGLMFLDSEDTSGPRHSGGGSSFSSKQAKNAAKKAGDVVSRFMGKFKL